MYPRRHNPRTLQRLLETVYPNWRPPQRSRGNVRRLIVIVVVLVVVGTLAGMFGFRSKAIPEAETRPGYIETLIAGSDAPIQANLDGILGMQMLDDGSLLVVDHNGQRVITIHLESGDITRLFDTRPLGALDFRDDSFITPHAAFFVESERVLYVRAHTRLTEQLYRVDLTTGSFEVIADGESLGLHLDEGPVVVGDYIAVTTVQGDGLLLLNLDGTVNRRIIPDQRFDSLAPSRVTGTLLAVTSGPKTLRRVHIEKADMELVSAGTTFDTLDSFDIEYEFFVHPSGHPAEALNGDIYIYMSNSTGAFIGRVDSDGLMERVAGNGARELRGDGGPALDANIASTVLAITAAGDLLLASDDRIRRIIGVDRLVREDHSTTTPPDPSGKNEIETESCFGANWGIPGVYGINSLDEAVEMSDVIVRGRVIGRHLQMDTYREKERPWAIHDFEVFEWLKGTSADQVVTVGSPFGCLDDGAEYVLFLNESETGVEYVDDPLKFDNPAMYAALWQVKFQLTTRGIIQTSRVFEYLYAGAPIDILLDDLREEVLKESLN